MARIIKQVKFHISGNEFLKVNEDNKTALQEICYTYFNNDDLTVHVGRNYDRPLRESPYEISVSSRHDLSPGLLMLKMSRPITVVSLKEDLKYTVDDSVFSELFE